MICAPNSSYLSVSDALSDRQYLSAAQDYGEEAQGNPRKSASTKFPGADEYLEDLSSFYNFVISGLEREADVDARGMMALLHGKSQADIVMARNIRTPLIIIFRALRVSTSLSPVARIDATRRVRWSDSASMQVENPATVSRSRKPSEWRCTAIPVRLIVRWRECELFMFQQPALRLREKELMPSSGSSNRSNTLRPSDPVGFCSDR